MNGTNNIQLDNLRLSNKVLENKLNEPPDNKLKAIEDKINLNTSLDRLIGYNNNIQDKINLTTSSISDIKNNNMELNNKINRVIEFGKTFAAETKRKFDNHELKQDDEKLVNLSAVFDNLDGHFAIQNNPLYNETTD